MKSITFNTVSKLIGRKDKPLMFHASFYCNSDKADWYCLYFTFDDINFDYIQTDDGKRKLYKTLDQAYKDVFSIDFENPIMLVTTQHNLVDVDHWEDC